MKQTGWSLEQVNRPDPGSSLKSDGQVASGDLLWGELPGSIVHLSRAGLHRKSG